jgi:hypothetical protein
MLEMIFPRPPIGEWLLCLSGLDGMKRHRSTLPLCSHDSEVMFWQTEGRHGLCQWRSGVQNRQVSLPLDH